MHKALRKLLFTTTLVTSTAALSQKSIYLYDKIPNSISQDTKDSIFNDRYYEIGQPRIAVYTTSADENKNAAILIIPGGGYHHVTHNMSGIQIAKWFNTIGFTAFVLYYRLPISNNFTNNAIIPIQDARRAMQIIRSSAAKYNYNVNKIGVMGTSAGGHLAASISNSSIETPLIKDSLFNTKHLPDFCILLSPVISMTDIGHKGSRKNLLGENINQKTIENFSAEKNISSNTPPTFIVHANNDKSVSPINSIEYYKALYKNGIEASLHIFPYGKHKITLKNNKGSTNMWTGICEEWLVEMGFLEF